MSDISGSDKVMSIQQEAAIAVKNVGCDCQLLAEYVMQRCADFTYDAERQGFIEAILQAVRDH